MYLTGMNVELLSIKILFQAWMISPKTSCHWGKVYHRISDSPPHPPPLQVSFWGRNIHISTQVLHSSQFTVKDHILTYLDWLKICYVKEIRELSKKAYPKVCKCKEYITHSLIYNLHSPRSSPQSQSSQDRWLHRLTHGF